MRRFLESVALALAALLGFLLAAVLILVALVASLFRRKRPQPKSNPRVIDVDYEID